MLVIRLQRTGRKGHAQFRIVVQDSRRTPTSGKIVANLGSYNPHNKTVVLDKEKAQKYLDNGAQPSQRSVLILKSEGIKLPKWVKVADTGGQRAVRNPEKRRSTTPAQPAEPVAESETPAESRTTEDEQPVDEAVVADEIAEESASQPEPEAEA